MAKTPTFWQNLVNQGGVNKLTLLKSGSDKKIFFIHGGNGLATAFISLCNKVDFNATCYGVGLPLWEENYKPQLRTMQEMAEWYIARIKKIQPHGPYTLCGYCIGALIGLEVAYLLEQSGEQVEAFYGIATMANEIACQLPPSIDISKEKDTVISFLGDTEQANFILKDANNETVWDVAYANLDAFAIDLPEFRERLFRLMQPVDIRRAIPHFDNCDAKEILRYINTMRSMNNLATTYRDHRIIHAPIYLFSADKDTMVPDIELNAKCWQSHTTADFENIIYDGDHFNMFESENNDDFCEKFVDLFS